MDASNPVLHGLLRKRQEMAGDLEPAQSQVPQLVLDIDALDSTIRLLHPDVEIDVVRIKSVARRHAAVQHESSRIIFGVLREAPSPTTTRETVQAVMEARGMNSPITPWCKPCCCAWGPCCTSSRTGAS